MNKKLLFSVILACLITSAVVLQVIAGATFDYGTLAGKAEDDPPPPEGAVNWVAWWDEYNGIPYEILTEDNTNCEEGVDLGYSKGIVPPMDLVNWQIQIENFLYRPRQYDPNRPDRKDPIYMVFGGLGEEFSGTLWKYTIPYWKITESRTDYGVVPIHTTEGAACPTIQQQPVFGEVRTVMFWGEPGYYHVYRSQNGSGHDTNNASNGQYLYLFSTTNESGVGTFTDSEPWDGPNWYLVIQADPETNAIIGCHSENANPTGTRVIDFKTEFDLAEKVIRLSWEKVANDVLGFNLYRSTSKDIEGDKIYSVWIGDPDADNEGLFSYVDDDDLEFGETYYYKLEILGLDMSRENIRPMSISQRAGYFFFMPLIQEGD